MKQNLLKNVRLRALALTSLLCTLFAGTAWGEKITDIANIVSGKQYYIGATTSSTDYYLSVDGSSTSTSIAGTAVTAKTSATVFTFAGGTDNKWTIQFESGNYLSLKSSKDNGKVVVSETASEFTASKQSDKIRLTIGDYSIQKNNSGTQFGSYANTQTDIWLEEVSTTTVLTTTTINVPADFNTDVHTSTAAGQLTATVSANGTAVSGATVTWESSNEGVATIDASGNVTLVAAGTTTITATYAGVEGQYEGSSATYTLTVTDSTPFTGGDVTFVGGTDLGSTTGTGQDQMTKSVVTVSSSSAAFATAEYRFYASSETTFSVPEGYYITKIIFTKNGSYDLSNLSTTTGTYDSNTGTWTGNAESVVVSAAAQVRLDQIVVTVATGTPKADPELSFSAATATATLGEAFTAPTLTNSHGLTVTYSSSNTSVATVDENTGAVTLVAAGETTITATFAGNDTYSAGAASYTLTVNAPVVSESDWEKTELSALTADDIFVIVGNNGSNYALANDKGTSAAPTAVSVTVNGNYLTGTIADNIKWNVSGNATDGYTFYPNGSTTTWLYCTATNNGVRVGTNDNKAFTINSESGYLLNSATSRYLGVYNSADWRCYTSINNNIKDQTFTFYKYVGKTKETPTLSFSNTKMIVKSSSLSEGDIVVPVLSVTPANLTVTYTLSGDDVVTLNSETGVVTLKGTPGEVEGTFTVTATSEENDDYYSASASYTYSIVKVYDNIAALRECASGTVAILNLTNAQVIYESGNDKYIKDETGAIDFYKIDTDTYVKYSVGQRFSGNIYVTYTDYNGLPEITEVHLDMSESSSTDEVTPTSLEVANVTLEDYVCDLVTVTGNLVVDENKYYISDGTNKLQVYDKFKLDDIDLTTLESGKTYTATGIVVPYNNAPELALTSIEESETQVFNLTITSAGYATLYLGSAVTIPEGVTVSYVSGYSGKALTLTPITGTIPANTGVILQAEAGTYAFAYTTDVDAISGNYLYGSVTSAETNAGDGSYLYYKLANDSSKGIGFYWGAENGAAFTSAANKAYLAIPASSGAKISGFALNDSDDATAITAVEDETITNNKVYDLTGREVKNPAKGVYIINGKKMFVK